MAGQGGAAGLSVHSGVLEDMCLQAYNPEKENSTGTSINNK